MGGWLASRLGRGWPVLGTAKSSDDRAARWPPPSHTPAAAAQQVARGCSRGG